MAKKKKNENKTASGKTIFKNISPKAAKAAAGAAGIIKVILSLYHRTLPPTINVTRPNPCIEWETSPLNLLTEPLSWESPQDHPRRAAVSAFGFGGTNGCLIFRACES